MTDQSPKTIAGPPLSGAPGSEVGWRVSMTERHSTDVRAKTRSEAIAVVQREGFIGGEYKCLGFTARRIPNDQAHARREPERT